MLGQGDGTITGLVLDEHGDPLAGASVHIEPTGTGAPSGYFDSAPTDAQGRFVERNLKWGSYDIFAAKEADGYPSHTWFIFKDDGQPVNAVLSEANRSAEVTIRLAPPAARLSSVHVSDAATGRPIMVTEPTTGKSLQIAGVNLIRNDIKTPTGLPAALSRGPGVLKNILVPADVPVIVQVYAEGYADWYYPGVPDESKAQPVRLKSGESLSFDVLLQALPGQ
jgi:hypothetical protein